MEALQCVSTIDVHVRAITPQCWATFRGHTKMDSLPCLLHRMLVQNCSLVYMFPSPAGHETQKSFHFCLFSQPSVYSAMNQRFLIQLEFLVRPRMDWRGSRRSWEVLLGRRMGVFPNPHPACCHQIPDKIIAGWMGF